MQRWKTWEWNTKNNNQEHIQNRKILFFHAILPCITFLWQYVTSSCAAYQWGASDGLNHRIEDVGRKAQQCRPTVNYSFIHVILKGKENGLSAAQSFSYNKRKFQLKQTNWIICLCSSSALLSVHNQLIHQARMQTLSALISNMSFSDIQWESPRGGIQRFAVYLFAIQVEILVTNFQLQNLHLVIPLLFYGGVPHGPPI